MSKKDIHDSIVLSMATIIWGNSWAQHIEEDQMNGETPCQNLSGCKIEEVMPEIPKIAMQKAIALAKRYRRANNVGLVELLVTAYRADGTTELDGLESISDQDLLEDIEDNDYLQCRFGECLAWMAMGDSISWFDDNKKFPLIVPNIDTYNVQSWAKSHCKECERKYAST